MLQHIQNFMYALKSCLDHCILPPYVSKYVYDTRKQDLDRNGISERIILEKVHIYTKAARSGANPLAMDKIARFLNQNLEARAASGDEL